MTSIANVRKHPKRKNRVRVCRARALSREKSPIFVVPRRGESSPAMESGKDKLKEKMVTKFLQLKEEMEEISEQQSCIRDGQRQVKEKFEAVESECKKLRAETMKIMQQSGWTRLRLVFMFQILKARENNDFARAAELTNALRELISQQNQEEGALGPKAGEKR